jgi:hypothetical protein
MSHPHKKELRHMVAILLSVRLLWDIGSPTANIRRSPVQVSDYAEALRIDTTQI